MVKLTPPMGWNSWNTFGENINEKLIFETADAMVEAGLPTAGPCVRGMKKKGLCRILGNSPMA